MTRQNNYNRREWFFHWWNIFAIITVGLLLAACKPQVPSEYLSPGEMEDILYDYHLAMNMAQQHGGINSETDVNMEAARLSVLKKHQVTEQEFESSLEYYIRHTERMHSIYEHLAQRLSDEALAQGASASEINQFGAVRESGDTTNIWAGDKAMILSSKAPFNSHSFAFKTDTAFHKGDRLILSLDAQYIIQQGSRDGVAVLAVRFNNDSVAHQEQRVSSNTHYNISVSDNQQLGIKEIRGYFMLSTSPYGSSTTLSLLCISNIQLFRMHDRTEKSDSTSQNNENYNPNVTRVPEERKDSVRSATKHMSEHQPPINGPQPSLDRKQPSMGTQLPPQGTPLSRQKTLLPPRGNQHSPAGKHSPIDMHQLPPNRKPTRENPQPQMVLPGKPVNRTK